MLCMDQAHAIANPFANPLQSQPSRQGLSPPISGPQDSHSQQSFACHLGVTICHDQGPDSDKRTILLGPPETTLAQNTKVLTSG